MIRILLTLLQNNYAFRAQLEDATVRIVQQNSRRDKLLAVISSDDFLRHLQRTWIFPTGQTKEVSGKIGCEFG